MLRRVSITLACLASAAYAWTGETYGLPSLDIPKLECENALWVENPVEKQFLSSKLVVVANLQGPGRIEMIHFAMPGALKLGREAILRKYWDGENTPSVDCPLVDFFCDPAGQTGTLRVFVIDPDRFVGGRNERLTLDGREFAVVSDFKNGKWIETRVTAAETADGQIVLAAENFSPDSNAVFSIVEWCGLVPDSVR